MGLFVVDPETMGEEDGFVCGGQWTLKLWEKKMGLFVVDPETMREEDGFVCGGP